MHSAEKAFANEIPLVWGNDPFNENIYLGHYFEFCDQSLTQQYAALIASLLF